jgi:hypothetical protein
MRRAFCSSRERVREEKVPPARLGLGGTGILMSPFQWRGPTTLDKPTVVRGFGWKWGNNGNVIFSAYGLLQPKPVGGLTSVEDLAPQSAILGRHRRLQLLRETSSTTGPRHPVISLVQVPSLMPLETLSCSNHGSRPQGFREAGAGSGPL